MNSHQCLKVEQLGIFTIVLRIHQPSVQLADLVVVPASPAVLSLFFVCYFFPGPNGLTPTQFELCTSIIETEVLPTKRILSISGANKKTLRLKGAHFFKAIFYLLYRERSVPKLKENILAAIHKNKNSNCRYIPHIHKFPQVRYDLQ